MNTNNLVEQFEAVVAQKTPEHAYPGLQAIQLIEQHTGIKTTHSRIKQWARGDLRPPIAIQNYMIEVVLSHQLGNQVSMEILNQLIFNLTLPEASNKKY